MSEAKVIAHVTKPGTRESLAADFRRLGLRSGQVILVPTSLSALGWMPAAGRGTVNRVRIPISRLKSSKVYCP